MYQKMVQGIMFYIGIQKEFIVLKKIVKKTKDDYEN